MLYMICISYASFMHTYRPTRAGDVLAAAQQPLDGPDGRAGIRAQVNPWRAGAQLRSGVEDPAAVGQLRPRWRQPAQGAQDLAQRFGGRVSLRRQQHQFGRALLDQPRELGGWQIGA